MKKETDKTQIDSTIENVSLNIPEKTAKCVEDFIKLHPVHKMTKQEAREKTDSELFQLLDIAKGHTRNFSSYAYCDFSYSFLTRLLKKRGYEKSWHKVNKEVTS